MRFFLQTLVLILSFLFVYTWQQTFLSQYTIQTIGALVFCYMLFGLSKKRRSKSDQASTNFNVNKILFGGNFDIFILNTIVVLLSIATGGLNGAFFFLTYFLAFGITFVFEPATVFIFVLGIILIFLPQALSDDVVSNMIKLGSLVFLSPLAFFFGTQYRQDEKLDEKVDAIKERSSDAADTIAADVEEVLRKEKYSLKPEDVEKLNDILEETEELRQEAKES